MIEIIKNAYSGYYNYLINEISNPTWTNYFYWLLLLSLFFWLLEIAFPWRKSQKKIRKDFWLDGFYMFFNFFIFNLIFFVAFSETTIYVFDSVLNLFGLSVKSLQVINLNLLPASLGLIVFFLISDFAQWGIHRLLHRIPFLWNFHKVHHSVKQMGFAAHLRYHWMETLVYRTGLYVPLAIIGGFDIENVFIVHIITLIIGHFNHSNFILPLGPLKYILNNPQMHIWHHAKFLPKNRRYGINFGLSLSTWDYLFKTNYIPHNGRDIELGFRGDTHFPKEFIKQELYPLTRKNEENYN